MITIKNSVVIRKMEQAGALLADIFCDLKQQIKEGVATGEIDRWIAQQLLLKNLISATKGYMGYQHVSCISVNDEVVHGVPSFSRFLKNGDFIKVDICASWQGYHADMARAFFVGDVSQDAYTLADVAQKALDKGIEKACPGNRLSDISAAIQQEVERHGFGVVRDFAGHGIGKKMHEDPEILNYGESGRGPILRPGMAFAIEPMITKGHYEIFIAEDGWTVKTLDKSLAAHVEDTVLITQQGPKILTRSTTTTL
ncbi:MAG: type I methionyl aminopeptidase [Candidatus Dependentiae bacterium]|nr:type I methionyl aminopeptidase [Candidatus Dependentiae bacterium]